MESLASVPSSELLVPGENAWTIPAFTLKVTRKLKNARFLAGSGTKPERGPGRDLRDSILLRGMSWIILAKSRKGLCNVI